MANKFNDLFDVKALQDSVKKADENGGGDFPDVPVGKYEVKIEKIELGESSKHMPMAKVQFRIVDGEWGKKKACLFLNQVLIGKDKETQELTAFGIHNFNEFLKSLDSGVKIEFKDFDQYTDLLLDVAEAVEKQKLTYSIQYSKKNDFPAYKVLEVFEN